MTFLDLCNRVLERLREDTIPTGSDPDTFLSDPYLVSIGEHVNDAKDRVEDAWQWSQLRGTDSIATSVAQVTLPYSDDSHYILKRITVDETNYFPKQVSVDWIRRHYAVDTVPTGAPTHFAFTGVASNDPAGDPSAYDPSQVITLYPTPDQEYNLSIDRVSHQARLVKATDRLLIPALPVFTLATALAAQERGEVGGMPSSEWFIKADTHLSDAIATDSAMYPSELDWDAGNIWTNTNFRY